MHTDINYNYSAEYRVSCDMLGVVYFELSDILLRNIKCLLVTGQGVHGLCACRQGPRTQVLLHSAVDHPRGAATGGANAPP